MWIVPIHETNMISVHPWLWLNMMIPDLNQFWWMCPSLKSIKSIIMICVHPTVLAHPLIINMIRVNHVNRAHPWNKYALCPFLTMTKYDDLRFESILMNVPILEINKIDFNNLCPSHYCCPSLEYQMVSLSGSILIEPQCSIIPLPISEMF